MKYDFTTSANRENTNAEKYQLREKIFHTDDVIPLWIADMDIDTPSFVLDALKKRLNHPILGYEEIPSSAFLAQKNWIEKQHNTSFALKDFLYIPSVISAINIAIQAFTQKGDKIIIQPPIYPPFIKSIKNNHRIPLFNPLQYNEDGTYSFDIKDLTSKIDKNTKMLLLCSPHNPVGRVWKKEELLEIFTLCKKHNIIVFSDEIHSDLVYMPNKHIPFASIDPSAKDMSITAMGIGKTFNLAGMAMSSVIIPNEILKQQFLKIYNNIHFGEGNILAHIAFQSAYTNGEKWLKALKQHLLHNYTMLQKICEKYPNLIKLTPIEGTYLAWIECKNKNLSNQQIQDFFIKKCKLGVSSGIHFGLEGSHFIRLNFAISHAKMSQVIQQLDNCLKDKNDQYRLG